MDTLAMECDGFFIFLSNLVLFLLTQPHCAQMVMEIAENML
jgi:hypothetical protein